jgi:hypothetical protein
MEAILVSGAAPTPRVFRIAREDGRKRPYAYNKASRFSWPCGSQMASCHRGLAARKIPAFSSNCGEFPSGWENVTKRRSAVASSEFPFFWYIGTTQKFLGRRL